MNFEDLTPEQREMAKSCKTPEEFLELAREFGCALSEEETKAAFDLSASMIPVCFIDLGFRTADYKGNPQHTRRNPLEKMVKRI